MTTTWLLRTSATASARSTEPPRRRRKVPLAPAKPEPWVSAAALSDAMQRALESMGHDVGGADGLPGFKTRRSIGRWQEAQGLSATCFPETAMKSALR